MRFQSLKPPPHDTRSIPWSSVVLPLGTLGGACTRGSQRVPVSRFGLSDHSLGGCSSSLQAFREKCRHVSVLLPHHSTALTLRGNFSMKVWAS
jgi:hypothetical protein